MSKVIIKVMTTGVILIIRTLASSKDGEAFPAVRQNVCESPAGDFNEANFSTSVANCHKI